MESPTRRAVRAVYDAVGTAGSRGPAGLQVATGGRLARELGYPEAALGGVPAAILEAFVGAAPLAALLRTEPGQRVLDLGCGAGLDSVLLQQSGAEVVAVDLSATMLRRLAEATDGGTRRTLRCVRAAAPHLPFREAVFDHVLLNGVANLVPEREELLGTVAGLLKPGGQLLLADLVALTPLPEELRDLPEAWAWCVAGASEPRQWREQLRGYGFRDVRIEVLEELPPLARAVVQAVRR